MTGPTEVGISRNEAAKESALMVRYQSTSKIRRCGDVRFHRLGGEAQLCTHSSSDPRQVASGNSGSLITLNGVCFAVSRIDNGSHGAVSTSDSSASLVVVCPSKQKREHIGQVHYYVRVGGRVKAEHEIVTKRGSNCVANNDRQKKASYR